MSLDDYIYFKMLLGTMQRGLVKTEEPAAIPTAESTFPFTAMWRNNDSDMPVTIVGVMGEMNGETYYQTESGTGVPASQVDRSVDVGVDEEI